MVELAKRIGTDNTARLTFHGMGLLALSDGFSADMAKLTASQEPAARFAVDYFCRQVSGAIGALAAKAGGIDALVFTAGIGEHSPQVRAKVCGSLDFLGFILDERKNLGDETSLGVPGSKPILCVAADEAGMMSDLVRSLLQQ
jgi:acetate kinase